MPQKCKHTREMGCWKWRVYGRLAFMIIAVTCRMLSKRSTDTVYTSGALIWVLKNNYTILLGDYTSYS